MYLAPINIIMLLIIKKPRGRLQKILGSPVVIQVEGFPVKQTKRETHNYNICVKNHMIAKQNKL